MNLPQLNRRCLADAGLETDILFNRGIDLPHFASIALLRTEKGRTALRDYYRGFLELAALRQIPLILESATWRARPDWAGPLGLSERELDRLNAAAIELLIAVGSEYRSEVPGIVVSGCIGPRGDGYDPGRIMTADEARAYHSHQIGTLHTAGSDMISAITMTNAPEAIGVVSAARDAGAPVSVSFTVETDGALPTGQTLADAMAEVDHATGGYPAYFMINCAHPDHFRPALEAMDAPVIGRMKGLRANASRCSHAELDAMAELDRGDPVELAALHRDLVAAYPAITVLGGCCGTDLEHISAMAEICFADWQKSLTRPSSRRRRSSSRR